MKYIFNCFLILILFIALTERIEAIETQLIPIPTAAIYPVPTPNPIPESDKKDKRSWIKSKYSILIDQTAQKYGLDPQLIYATIMTESNGNEHAYRFEPKLNDSSLGLGQILTSTARMLGFCGNPQELYKPDVGIDLIGRYHRHMLNIYGNLSPVQLATAYNAGNPYRSAIYGHINRFNNWYFEEV